MSVKLEDTQVVIPIIREGDDCGVASAAWNIISDGNSDLGLFSIQSGEARYNFLKFRISSLRYNGSERNDTFKNNESSIGYSLNHIGYII